MTRIALAALFAACQPSSAAAPLPSRPAQQLALLDLAGTWRWILHTDENATSRVEDELWQLHADPAAPSHLVGRYLRTVEVRSTDHVPFPCNQRLFYRQRALFDVTAEAQGGEFVMHETGYQVEPSPCDHGFRQTGAYHLEPLGTRAVLRWDDGTQTLWHIDAERVPLPEPPWGPISEPTGAWRWALTSYDEDHYARDEAEWWEITWRSATALDATYRRRVTVRTVDGSTIPCANAPSWSYEDAYVLDGVREEEHWHLREVAVEPGEHPCLAPTPTRTLDEATAEQIGDYLVLEWRGKRRQVLHRPD